MAKANSRKLTDEELDQGWEEVHRQLVATRTGYKVGMFDEALKKLYGEVSHRPGGGYYVPASASPATPAEG